MSPRRATPLRSPGSPPGFAAFDSGHVDDGETGEPEAPPSDEDRSSAQQEAAAEHPEPAADAEAPDGRAPDTGDAEQAAPSEPSNGAPDGEAIAPTGHDAIDAMNAVPVTGGGPRVIVNTVGFENGDDGNGDASTEDVSRPRRRFRVTARILPA